MGVCGIMQRAAKTTLYAYSACTMIIVPDMNFGHGIWFCWLSALKLLMPLRRFAGWWRDCWVLIVTHANIIDNHTLCSSVVSVETQ